VNLIQFIISIPLFLILAFGLGFIINMVVKTTWMPIILYLIVVVYLFIKFGGFKWPDYVILFTGLCGAAISGWTIQFLRNRGYRMF